MSSQRVWSYQRVAQYGLTQLGLRSHPSWTFTPETVTTSLSLLRPDEPVYTTPSVRPASPCQPTSAVTGPIFSNIRYPHLIFPGGFHDYYRCLFAGVGRLYGGFPNLGYLNPFGSPAPYQLFGAQGDSCCLTPLGFSAPGPPGFDRYGQHYSSYLYKQTRRDPFPNLVASSSGSLYVAAGSGHSSQSQAHTRLFECDSGPPIQTQSANIDKVESPFRDCESDFPLVPQTRELVRTRASLGPSAPLF